jgi:hypothetical protein
VVMLFTLAAADRKVAHIHDRHSVSLFFLWVQACESSAPAKPDARQRIDDHPTAVRGRGVIKRLGLPTTNLRVAKGFI